MSERVRKRWAIDLCRRHHDLGADWLVALAANRVADALGLPPVIDGPIEPPGGLSAPPGGWADPWLVGLVHEQSATAADRRARGAWYTPRPVVIGLLRLATAEGHVPARIVDPTCGGGAFLLAALDRLVELGLDPEDAVARIGGMDVDPVAVRASAWSVGLWLGARGAGAAGEWGGPDVAGGIDVSQGDSLRDWPTTWSGPLVVAGNPPFASPLKRGAVSTTAADRRGERADLLGPYADVAAVHLLDAVEKAGPGSTVVLVQPQSILSSRDTDALRAHLEAQAPLVGLWVAREAVFDAGVRVCAPVLRVGGSGSGDRRVRLADGPEVTTRVDVRPQPWGALAADALGAPPVPPSSGQRPSGRLGDLASATAGFRDEHYGLVSVCREARPDEDGGDGVETARLVTVGSVDPLDLAWGRRALRFGGRNWERPIVTRSGLSDRVARWFDAQLGPKVLLATQTKLLEPVVDRTGDLMPATPLIAVHADPDDLDRVAAVLLAPPVVLWAWRRWFGTALTVDAVKLAARHVAELPLPSDHDRWDEAAAIIATVSGSPVEPAGVGSGHLAVDAVVAVGEIMTSAYGADPEVLDWWLDRLARPPITGDPSAG